MKVRNIKKFAVVLMTMVMTAGMYMTVLATPGVSAQEQKLLDEAVAQAKALGVDTAQSETFKNCYAQAETILTSQDLNEGQVNAMLNQIQSVASDTKTKMNEYGISSLRELSNTKNFDFKAYAQKKSESVVNGAKGVRIKISINADGTVDASVTQSKGDNNGSNSGGSSSVSSGSVIKQTGMNLDTTAVNYIFS